MARGVYGLFFARALKKAYLLFALEFSDILLFRHITQHTHAQTQIQTHRDTHAHTPFI